MAESVIVPDLVHFTGFRGRRHQTRNYLPKYLITLLLCPKGKVEGAVYNKGFNLNQKGVGPGAIKEASSKEQPETQRMPCRSWSDQGCIGQKE